MEDLSSPFSRRIGHNEKERSESDPKKGVDDPFLEKSCFCNATILPFKVPAMI